MEPTFDLDDDLAKDRVGYYLKQIGKSNALLLRISENGLDTFIEDEMALNAGCFLLQRSVAGCINLGIHIITTHDFRTPESYHAIFDILTSENVIPPGLAPKMQSIASIRNQLVNLDPELDILTVFNAIRHDLSSILAFEKHIINWLSPAI